MIHMIAIAGLRGSGKTTLMNRIVKSLQGDKVKAYPVQLYRMTILCERVTQATEEYIKDYADGKVIEDDELCALRNVIALKLALDDTLSQANENDDSVFVFDRYTETYAIDYDRYPLSGALLASFPIPDLHVLLHIDMETARTRVLHREGFFKEETLEQERARFALHNRLLSNENHGYYVVDATLSSDDILKQVLPHVGQIIQKTYPNVLALGFFSAYMRKRLIGYRYVNVQSVVELQAISSLDSYDAIIFRSPFMLTKEILDRTTRLRLIIRAGSGIDNISNDIEQRGVCLVRAGENHRAVAEHALGLLFAALRHVVVADNSIRKGMWLKNELVGREVTGKTIGIIGFGKIGRDICHLLSTFNVRFLVFDHSMEKEEKKLMMDQYPISLATLNMMAINTDIVFLAIPLTSKTKWIIDKTFLKSMKKDAILINVARGDIVSHEDLIFYLKANPAFTYAADVFHEEPPGEGLIELPNTILTPHIGAQTIETRENVEQAVCDALNKFF